ncbi:MAG: AraC family transcriptional regulator [Victivallales bacterium]
MTCIVDSCEFELLIADRSVLGREWKSEHHSDPFGRIYLIESGSGFVEHHGRRFILRPGNLYLIPAHTELSFGCGKRVVICWFHFNVLLENGTDLFSRIAVPYEIESGKTDATRDNFIRLIDLFGQDSVYKEFQQRACLLHILSLFLKESDCSPEIVSHERIIRFRPILKQIEDNIYGKLTVCGLASQMKMEPESFSRAFSRCFGTSPVQYIQRKKIARARKIMSETDRKLQDIAEELGFTDAFHFSKTFKRLTGKSPKDFRSLKMDVMP